MELLTPQAMAEQYKDQILAYVRENLPGIEEPEILMDECFMQDERTYGFMILDKAGMYGVSCTINEDGTLSEFSGRKV